MLLNNMEFLRDIIGLPNTHENAFVDIAARETDRQRGRGMNSRSMARAQRRWRRGSRCFNEPDKLISRMHT